MVNMCLDLTMCQALCKGLRTRGLISEYQYYYTYPSANAVTPIS